MDVISSLGCGVPDHVGEAEDGDCCGSPYNEPLPVVSASFVWTKSPTLSPPVPSVDESRSTAAMNDTKIGTIYFDRSDFGEFPDTALLS
jgi:hypothetical protein